MSNPEIQARLHAWQGAKEERSAAAGGFFPRVDVSAGAAREHRDSSVFRGTYNQNQTTVTLTQLLYDGFATRNEVRRLDHAALVRFFELHDTSENITLEIVRAYADVMRYRKLVSLAEENYVRHRVVFDQIQAKVQAKVGRRVDLETSSGRLALAEANLATEVANLHDVSARFTRLTGKAPGRDIGSVPSLSGKMPADAKTAFSNALAYNPALWAALQNIKAARHAAQARNGSYHPRVEFQARNYNGHNISGTTDQDTVRSAGVVLNWNIFNGGADNARARQFAKQISAAEDLTDKACRDMRQTLAIAYNDTRKLAEQINYLDQHQLATEKARDAYRKQFDIGQRSLLDLLDTENELFQAQRAYTNAVHDLNIAYARVAAAMGQLVTMLGLTAQEASALPEVRTEEDRAFLASRCPAEMPLDFASDKAALEIRVAQLAKESAPATAAVEEPAGPASPTSITSKAAPNIGEQEVTAAVTAWAKAWSAKNVEAYLGSYDEAFQAPGGVNRRDWERQRRAKILGKQRIDVQIEDLKIALDGERATAIFRQVYHSESYSETGMKTLVMAKRGGTWKIVSEQSQR